MVVLLFILGMYIISCIISIPIVKKRKFVAKQMIIGKETTENIETIKEIAKNIYYNKQLPKNDIYKINIEEGKVSVGNDKVDIIYNGNEHFIINKAFSEKSAVFFVGLYISGLLSLFISVLILFTFLWIGFKI